MSMTPQPVDHLISLARALEETARFFKSSCSPPFEKKKSCLEI